MSNEYDDIDDLIGKVLTGEATEEETSEVNEWTLKNKSNLHYFEQMRAIFEKTAAMKISVQFDADAAWQKVRNKISSDRRSIPMHGIVSKSKTEFGFGPVLKIAAGIFILISAGLAAWLLWPPAVQTQIVSTTTATRNDSLPDGSVAFLNKKSSIAFEYNPRRKIREVKLTGEAFFDVRHEKTKPFVIQSDEVFIKDIGTAFNVVAWPEGKTVEVTVEEGEVQFYTLDNPGMILHAGEMGVYDRITRQFSRTEKADTNVLSYKTRMFTFNNTDMRSVVALINSVYDVDILLADDDLNNCRLTVNFNNDSIDTIIDVLAETMGLTVSRKDSQIILSGTGCAN